MHLNPFSLEGTMEGAGLVDTAQRGTEVELQIRMGRFSKVRV